MAVIFVLVAARAANEAPVPDRANVIQVSSAGFNQACFIVGKDPMKSMIITAIMAMAGELNIIHKRIPIKAEIWQTISNLSNLLSPNFSPSITTAKHSIAADKDSTPAAH